MKRNYGVSYTLDTQTVYENHGNLFPHLSVVELRGDLADEKWRRQYVLQGIEIDAQDLKSLHITPQEHFDLTDPDSHPDDALLNVATRALAP